MLKTTCRLAAKFPLSSPLSFYFDNKVRLCFQSVGNLNFALVVMHRCHHMTSSHEYLFRKKTAGKKSGMILLEYIHPRLKCLTLCHCCYLRMYCIDRAGVPESHDAHTFCKAVHAASVKHKY